jgi:hypothetical protein
MYLGSLQKFNSLDGPTVMITFAYFSTVISSCSNVIYPPLLPRYH